MIDIHNHILPGIDDGSKSVEESIQLLKMQVDNGVTGLFFTPHFYPERMDFDTFVERRENAWQKIQALNIKDIEMRYGAEVRYSPKLLQMDLDKLKLQKTSYLLLELDFDFYPTYVERDVVAFQERGITPILAHVERFEYFRKKPELLKNLIDLGCIAEVGAKSLLSDSDKGFAKACLDHNLAILTSSDTHNPEKRPPCLGKLNKVLSAQEIKNIDKVSHAIWNNEVLPLYKTSVVKKKLFSYK